MRNALIGFFCLAILLLSGVAVSTSESRTLRQNELDNSLGKAMEQSMIVLKENDTYEIANKEEFIADFIQNTLIQLNSDSDYKITIYTADFEKGLLDAEVEETYNQVFGKGSVSVRKTVVADQEK